MTIAGGITGSRTARLRRGRGRFDPVLGLGCVELSTATKMFCACSTTFGAEPNTQVCPVCLGLPGALPTLNEAAVESAIRIGWR